MSGENTNNVNQNTNKKTNALIVLNNEQYLERWLHCLEFTNKKSKGTVKTYKTNVSQFIKGLNGKLLTEVTREEDIYSFISEKYLSANYCQNRQATLQSFYKWLTKDKYIKINPLPKGEGYDIEIPETVPTFLKEEEIEKINKYLKKQINYQKRDKKYYAIFNFLIGSGLRSTESLEIKMEDLCFAQGSEYVKVRRKGNKEQTIPLSNQCAETLKEYIKYNKITTGYIFPNKEGGHIGYNALYQLFKQIKKGTGIEVHPHLTRHTWAVWMLAKEAPIEYIQTLMGHKDVETTKIYTGAIPDKNLRKIVNDCALNHKLG